MKSISRRIKINPVAASRPRVTKRGTYYAKEYESFKKSFPLLLGKPNKLNGALSVIIALTIPVPKSITKKEKLSRLGNYHTMKPDADNYAKAILDAMNGIYYEDDAQVAMLSISKKWGVEGEIQIVVREIEEKEKVHENQMTIDDVLNKK